MKTPEGYYIQSESSVVCVDGFRYRVYIYDDAMCAIVYQDTRDGGGWVNSGAPVTFDVNIAEAIAAQIIAVAKAHKEAGQ